MAARKRAEERKLSYLAVVYTEGSGYFAFCPSLTKCYGHGSSPAQALTVLRDQVERELKATAPRGEPFPENKMVSVAILEVSP